MIYLILVTLIWSFSFGLIKGELTGINPLFVSFLRLLISAIVFLPFIIKIKLRIKHQLQLLGIGAIQFGVMYSAYIYSYQYLPAYQIALLTIFTPFYVTLINDIIEKKFSKLSFIAAVLSIIGAGIIMYDSGNSYEVSLGIILVQISNLCFATGQVLYKKIKPHIPIKDYKVFSLLYIGAVIFILILLPLSGPLKIADISLNQWYILIYLGAVASGLGFFLWNYGATKVNAGILSASNNLKVPSAVLVSLLFFAEAVDLTKLLLGGSIVLLSVLINYKFVINRK